MVLTNSLVQINSKLNFKLYDYLYLFFLLVSGLIGFFFCVCVFFLILFLEMKYIPLFRERLSYKREKTNATMSKVIMGNGDFTVFPRGVRKQHKHVYSKFLLRSC